MNRFILAAALATVGALAFSNKADAQYNYGYRTYVPGGGVVQNNVYASPYGVRQSQSIYTPYGSTYRAGYSNVWGGSGYRVGAYNPVGNFGYRANYNFNPYYGGNFNYGYRFGW